ncbi:DUF3027 domain-containing protein [Naasia aerilata]|uniref:DUF3027 domain-containing protein n=1 Tax=Naasia aerilata TaxID=1162966 RepID=A0ABN6XIZ8_9MICO|nr:DUF3027 domain-containing protein [Naasia aerilata]BDZ44811.1 hypothetical protein GCM10025866_07200 [Naasia aerilata]
MREPAEHETTVVQAARAALLETTPEDTVGELIGLDEPAEGVVDVLFGTAMPGYPGWSWTVSVSVADGAESPSVLELSLLPGDEALVAPEWVPWSDRLADYRAAQEAKDGALESVEGEDDEIAEEDLLDDDADELDGVDFEEAVLDDDDEDDDVSGGDASDLDDDLDDDDLDDDDDDDEDEDDDLDLDEDDDRDGDSRDR